MLTIRDSVQNKLDDSKIIQLYRQIQFDRISKMIYNYIKKQRGNKIRFQTDPKHITRNKSADPNEHLYLQQFSYFSITLYP